MQHSLETHNCIVVILLLLLLIGVNLWCADVESIFLYRGPRLCRLQLSQLRARAPTPAAQLQFHLQLKWYARGCRNAFVSSTLPFLI